MRSRIARTTHHYESCKANRIDPYRYLTWLFQRLPLAKTVDDYDALLPWKMPAHFR